MEKAEKEPIRITVESQTTTEAFNALEGAALEDKLRSAIASSKVVVFGRSTCPFCIEVTRTFVEMAVPFTYYRLDQMEQGAQVHEELKKLTGQKTVPYVYINGSLVGGCNDTKDLIASGEFDKKLGALEGGSVAPEEHPTMLKLAGVDEDAPKVIGALLEFPNTVDNRVIRLVGLQIFFISLFITIFSYKKDQSWHWVSVGMLVDFCLRFYGGAGISPLGSIAQLVTALMDLLLPKLGIKTGPVWGAGPPKQFAVSVGIFFSVCIVVFQFTHLWVLSTIFAAILCFFAGLEAFLNFCAGCLVFGYAIKFGVVPDTVYMIHINTLPETKYTWHDFTKRVNPPQPKRVVERFAPLLRGGKATKIDLHYKIGKTDDWEQEDFHIIKHSKIGFFSGVIGVAAIPAMFKFMAMIPSMNTPNLVWQILTLLSLVYTSIFLFPYLLKLFMYPRKVQKEWDHPVFSNAFSVPFMTLVVYAFLAEHYSRPLARVLFWAGAGPMMLLAIIVVGNWLSSMRHDGHVNGAWQMTPVGLYIAAVVGPIVDPRYTQVCFWWFGFASIMYITLFIFTFQKTVVGHNADPRQRMFAAIWVAAPAVASIAWTVLNYSPAWKMDGVAQTLFFIAFSMGLLLAWMAWRRFLWAEKFFMPMWAFGFPTAGLAWAAILYDWTIDTALSKVLAVSLIAWACIVCSVLTLRTLGGICRLKVFIPEHRWGPMSHLPLAQESMRAILHQLTDATDALAGDPANGRLAARVNTLWSSFKLVNTFYTKLKLEMCFPQIGSWFPGHQDRSVAQHQQMMDMQGQVDALLAGVSKGSTNGALAAAVVPTSMDGLSGGTPAEQIANAAAKAPLLLVGRSTCPFCIEVSRTFSEMGLPYTYYQVDNLPNGAELHQSLKEATGQKTVPYVYISGQMVGGCNDTKDLIASGEFDKKLGGAHAANSGKGTEMATVQAQVRSLAEFAVKVFDDVEDHIRPVTRRYISGPVQKKIMNDCWDMGRPEEWFQAIPLVVQHLPMLGQRLTYIRAFLWAMPERCQQIGVMVALGTDPVNWYRIRRSIPDITPRGESGYTHF